MNHRLIGLCCLMAASTLTLRADFVTLWELGTDNGSQADFSLESGGANPPPGIVSFPDEVPPGSEGDINFVLGGRDDDYYFAGLYPDPIGLVEEDEPWKAFERALVPSDPGNRIHFILDEFQAAATNRLRFTVDTYGLGANAGESSHDLQFLVNGHEIHAQAGITSPTLFEITVSAGAVEAVEGENIFEIFRSGGSGGAWIQFDYIRAEVDTDICGDPICQFTASAIEVAPGKPVTLNWIASPSSALVLNPGAINVTAMTTNGLGSIELVPDDTTTYTLTATLGAAVQTLDVTVTVPRIQSFAANRVSLSHNESVTLFWHAQPQATLSIDQGVGQVNAQTDADGFGQITVSPGNQERTYTLTATRGAGSATASVTIGHDEFGILWNLGVDDGSQADFIQEVGGTREPPGSASALDDDYYFAGVYPDPIGVVYQSENPATNFERAVTSGGTTTRIHFSLSEPPPPPDSQVRLTVDLFAGGWWDAATNLGGAGFGIHDVAMSVNGIEIWSEFDITFDTLAESTFTAGSVNLTSGENVLEIIRTGGIVNDDPANGAWIQFDYLLAEINTNVAAPALPPVITAVTRDPGTGALTLTWTSLPGQLFLVESSNNLVAWPDLATGYPTGGATGTTTSFTHEPAATDTSLYYRVSRQ